MIEIFYINDEEASERCMEIPEYYARRAREAGSDKVRREALASGYLLAEHLGAAADTEVRVNEFGKPYIEGEHKYFSLSHDDGMTVLAVSDEEVGVDIEKLHPVRESLVSRIFPPSYRKELEGVSEDERPLTFTRLWTQIEAALKCAGTGFRTDILECPEFFDDYSFESKVVDDFIITISMKKRESL